MIKKIKFKLIILSVLIISCTPNTDYIEKIQNPELFQEAMQNLTDIIVYDIFSPPVASRVYLYPSIAAYETMRFSNKNKYAEEIYTDIERYRSLVDVMINFEDGEFLETRMQEFNNYLDLFL